MHQRIALIEDEMSLVMTLTDRLESEGYEIVHFGDGQEAMSVLAKSTFDLILLDLMLPNKGGLDICRDLRNMGIQIPILMLTARRETVDKVLGLKLGADDYLTKPFEMMELLARIEALLRRQKKMLSGNTDSFCFGEVIVDFNKAMVFRNDEEVTMSALEFKLLSFLIENRDKILSRNDLLDGVWGYESDVFTRTVDVHILNLRQKLEPIAAHPTYIQTVHGRGYRFSTT